MRNTTIMMWNTDRRPVYHTHLHTLQRVLAVVPVVKTANERITADHVDKTVLDITTWLC